MHLTWAKLYCWRHDILKEYVDDFRYMFQTMLRNNYNEHDHFYGSIDRVITHNFTGSTAVLTSIFVTPYVNTLFAI